MCCASRSASCDLIVNRSSCILNTHIGYAPAVKTNGATISCRVRIFDFSKTRSRRRESALISAPTGEDGAD